MVECKKKLIFFKKPCITLRDETEWVELVQCGANILVGADYNKILDAVRKNKVSENVFKEQLYGDGNSGQKK